MDAARRPNRSTPGKSTPTAGVKGAKVADSAPGEEARVIWLVETTRTMGSVLYSKNGNRATRPVKPQYQAPKPPLGMSH